MKKRWKQYLMAGTVMMTLAGGMNASAKDKISCYRQMIQIQLQENEETIEAHFFLDETFDGGLSGGFELELAGTNISLDPVFLVQDGAFYLNVNGLAWLADSILGRGGYYKSRMGLEDGYYLKVSLEDDILPLYNTLTNELLPVDGLLSGSVLAGEDGTYYFDETSLISVLMLMESVFDIVEPNLTSQPLLELLPELAFTALDGVSFSGDVKNAKNGVSGKIVFDEEPMTYEMTLNDFKTRGVRIVLRDKDGERIGALLAYSKWDGIEIMMMNERRYFMKANVEMTNDGAEFSVRSKEESLLEGSVAYSKGRIEKEEPEGVLGSTELAPYLMRLLPAGR